jgi:RND superfamily putative drug exporter
LVWSRSRAPSPNSNVLGHLTNVSTYAVNLTTALGLGLGIDYSLLIVNRFREELARHGDTEAAVARTLQTAGRTVVFSSATVARGLAAMVIFPLYFLRSFAYAEVGVVIIAMITSRWSRARAACRPGSPGERRTNLARASARPASEESPFWRRTAVTRHAPPAAHRPASRRRPLADRHAVPAYQLRDAG